MLTNIDNSMNGYLNNNNDDWSPIKNFKHIFTIIFAVIAVLIIPTNTSVAQVIEMMISYTRIHGAHLYKNILSYGVAIGKWFSEKFQSVLELNGFSNFNTKLYPGKLSLTPGFTYKISGQLLFVLGFQLDLIGKSEDKSFGYFSAFTISF